MPSRDNRSGRSSILLIAHFYPPSREVAARRPEALAKYLARRGHEITVLTTRAFGADRRDGEPNPRVVRTYDLQLGAARLRGEQTATDALSRSEYSGPTLVGRLAVPDGHLLAWVPFAWHEVRRLLRGGRYDCVVTTSPPESTHFIGRSLQRRGAAWIADLRDGWVFEALVKQRIWPFELQHRINERLEHRTLRHADLITAVTEPLVLDVRRRLGMHAELVTNGFDPEKTEGKADASFKEAAALDQGLDDERISVVYTGRLDGANRDPHPLVAALVGLARSNSGLARNLELVFAGSFTREEKALFETDVAPARIVNLGLLTHAQTLALQRAADSLVMITNPSLTYQAPAKLYEYIATGRPILALASPGNASEAIIDDASAGIVVPPEDTEAIAGALAKLAGGEVLGADAESRERYSYPVLAERFGELVDATVTRVGAAAGGAVTSASSRRHASA